MPVQLVAVLVAFALGVVPSAERSGSPATLARIEVRLTMTSSSASASFDPGRIVASRVVSAASATVVPQAQGWNVTRSASGTASVVIHAVYEEPGTSPTVTIALRKALRGSAGIEVLNTSRRPFTAARLNARDGASAATTALTRRGLLGASNPRIGPSESRRLVLAAYYPWFGGGVYGGKTLSDRPAERRSTARYPEVLSMVRQARAHGIDGLVVSWQGEAANGRRFDLVLRAAGETGGVAAPYLSMFGANPQRDTRAKPDPATVSAWLDEALDRAAHPSFLKSDGVPVVFVYHMFRMGRPAWLRILDDLARSGRRVRLVGDAPLERYGDVAWGFHQYNPNRQTPEELRAWNRSSALDLRLLQPESLRPRIFVATVSPGYDDRKARGDRNPVTARGPNGERYASTWEVAFASSPDWILVSTWNEWYEGTHVEPGVATGDLALRQTKTFSATFKR